MTTILPVRFIDQRATGPNGDNNCVPTSIAEGAACYGQTLDPGQLVGTEYGAGYRGPTAPWRFSDDAGDIVREHGLDLLQVNGLEADLVARIHQEIQARHPVLIAIPSQWGNFNIPISVRRTQRNPDGSWLPTHFVCVYEEGPGYLAAANPWGGFRHENSDANWAKLLVLGAVWILEGTTSMAGTPSGWSDDGTTLKAPNGVITNGYIRDYIRKADWPADLLPVAQMYGIPGGWQQEFVASRIVGASTSGAMSTKAGPDYAGAVNGLKTQLTQAEKDRDAAQAQVKADEQTITDQKAQLAQMQAEIDQLKASSGGSTGPDALGDAVRALIKQVKAEEAKA